jgi:hypothetical protein
MSIAAGSRSIKDMLNQPTHGTPLQTNSKEDSSSKRKFPVPLAPLVSSMLVRASSLRGFPMTSAPTVAPRVPCISLSIRDVDAAYLSISLMLLSPLSLSHPPAALGQQSAATNGQRRSAQLDSICFDVWKLTRTKPTPPDRRFVDVKRLDTHGTQRERDATFRVAGFQSLVWPQGGG